MTDTGLPPLRHMVAVCGGSEADRGLLAAAAGFAERNGARLTLLSVIEPPAEAKAAARAAGVSLNVALERLAEERRARIRSFLPADLDPRIEIRTGRRFVEVVQFAIAEQVDFVLKTAEPLAGLQRFLFSSTDHHLLRKCPCPVWLLQPDAPPTQRRIVAAVDVDTQGAEEPGTLSSLNRSVLDAALRIASGPGTTIDALHAWDAAGEDLIRRWSDDPHAQAAAQDYAATAQNRRAGALGDLVDEAAALAAASGLTAPRVLPRLERGGARRIIPEWLGKVEADTLVIGTVARTGVLGVIIGNTSEDILNSVACSVVAVKPPGFASPIAPRPSSAGKPPR